MRFFWTLIIGIIASALLGAAIYDVQGNGLLSLLPSQPRPAGQKFLKVESTTIQRIEIRSSGQDKLVIAKKHNASPWEVIAPFEDRADPRRVALILAFIEKSEIIDSFTIETQTLPLLGLQEGETKISIFGADGQVIHSFALGDISPWRLEQGEKKPLLTTLYARYLKKGHERNAYILSDPTQNIRQLLSEQLKRIQDHRPLLFTPSTVQSIELSYKDSDVLLKRKNQQSPWRIEKPLELKTDKEAIKNLLLALVHLEATELSSDSTNSANTEDTLMSISIKHFDEDQTNDLVIYKGQSENPITVPAKVNNRDSTFLLPIRSMGKTAGVSALPRSVNALRYRALTSINPKALKTISIRGVNREEILLTRDKPDDSWQYLTNQGLKDVDQGALFKFLVALNQEPVVAFVSDAATDLSEWQLDKPDLAAALIGFDKKIITLLFKRLDGNILVHRVGEPRVKAISEDTFGAISQSITAYRNKKLWQIDRVDIEKLIRQRQGQEPVQLKYNFVTEEWSAKRNNEDATAQLIPARATKLLERLEQLHVVQWLSKRNEKAFNSLLDPDLVLEIFVVDDETGETVPRTLRLASITQSTRNSFFYGHLSGEPDFFILDLPTIQALNVDLFEN